MAPPPGSRPPASAFVLDEDEGQAPMQLPGSWAAQHTPPQQQQQPPAAGPSPAVADLMGFGDEVVAPAAAPLPAAAGTGGSGPPAPVYTANPFGERADCMGAPSCTANPLH